jgi:hypothetical protein
MAISYPYDFIDGVERTKVSSIWNSKRPGWPSSGDADDLMFGAGDDADHDGGHAEPRGPGAASHARHRAPSQD